MRSLIFLSLFLSGDLLVDGSEVTAETARRWRIESEKQRDKIKEEELGAQIRGIRGKAPTSLEDVVDGSEYGSSLFTVSGEKKKKKRKERRNGRKEDRERESKT